MNGEFLLGVGAAHEFEISARKAGMTNVDFTLLTQSEDKIKAVISYLRGHAEFVIRKYMVDLFSTPSIPSGLAIESHQPGPADWEWDATKVALYLDDGQKAGGAIKGDKLQKKLEGKATYNACLLDFFISNPQLIPDSWKGKIVFFWGTIYCDSDGDLCVRDLYWGDGAWRTGSSYLDYGWDSDFPALVSAQ